MKLTIITINYNNLKGLQNTFDSVFSQTWQEFEYIVIDGGSTDGSKELIEKYSHKIDYWVSENDNGVYSAINKGIQKSTGMFLNFMNSGDYFYEQNTLEQVKNKFIKTNDIVYGNAFFIKDGKQWVEAFPDFISFYYFYLYTINHQSSFIQKRLFEMYGLYDESIKINADWKFYMEVIFLHNAQCTHVNQIIAVFEHNGISSNINNIPLILEERKTIMNSYFKNYLPDYEMLHELNSNKRTQQFFTIRKSKVGFRVLKWAMSFINLFLPKAQYSKKLFRF